MSNLFNKQTDNKSVKKSKVIKEPKIKKEVKKYKIWSIKEYKFCGKKFIDNNFVELELNELLEALKTDCGYHMRIISNSNYIFYGDCDGFKPFQKKTKKSQEKDVFEVFAQLLISFLSKHYQIELDMNDISYTSNESKPGYYHYSVPKLYGSAKKLAEIHDNFQKYDEQFIYIDKNGKKQIVVDSGVYTTKWFRYPNQTKEFAPGTEHFIKHGQMIDFVVEYIPEYSTCIDNKKFNDNTKKGEKLTTKDRKKNLSIDNLSVFTQSELEQYNTMNTKNQVNEDINCDDTNRDDSDIENQNDTAITKKLFGGCYKKKTCDKKDTRMGSEHANKCSEEGETISLNSENDSNNDNDNDDNENKKNKLIDPVTEHTYDKQNIYAQILSRLDLYESEEHWANIGMALRNESDHKYELFNVWDKWSRQSKTKYKGTAETKKKWDYFIFKDDGFHVNWLLTLVKKHRPVKENIEDPSEEDMKQQIKDEKEWNKEYKKLCSYVNMHKIIKCNKKYFPQNKCDVDKINELNNAYNIIVKDDHCPICEDAHNDNYESHIFLEITGKGKAGMKCTHDSCYGKMCPKNGISLVNTTPYHKNIVFCNNYGTIINNNYENKKSSYNFKLLLNKNIAFVGDSNLNKLLLDALSKNDLKIAKVIAHDNDKMCFHNRTWYQFDGMHWKNIENAVCDMVVRFIDLIDSLEKRVIESELITDDEKQEYCDRIDEIKELVNNPKKNKNIFIELEILLTKNISFDTNQNLFAFNNGVYDFDKMAFRSMDQSDMIKKTCGFDYVDKYVDRQLLVDELMEVFPNKETMDCFLNYVALGMAGKNNLNIIVILQWITARYLKKMKNMLMKLFGEYALSVESLKNIIDDKIDMPQLETIRFLIMTSVKCVTSNDVAELIDSKCIERKNATGITENIHFKFAILGMTCDELQIDLDIIENIGHITMIEKKFKNTETNTNDLFLLLIEYLNYQGCQYDRIKFVQNDNRSDDEKVYDEFIQNYLIEKKGNKEKASDILIWFFQWKEEHKKVIVANSEQKIRTGLNTRIKLMYEYKLSMRIGPCTTSGFINVKCIY